MVDAHLEHTIILLNLGISCGQTETKCLILTRMKLRCLTAAKICFGNMIGFVLTFAMIPFHSID